MKKFNYTGRKKILREDVKIRFHGEPNKKPTIDVLVNLLDYEFSNDSHVFLEAQQWKTRFKRISLGLVEDNIRKNNLPLDEFDDAEGLVFRIKVVNEEKGLLLGIADNVKSYEKDDEQDVNNKSILPVSSVDLSKEGVLWRIDYSDQQAVLQIEQDLGAKETVVRSLMFKGLILPAAMRQILIKVAAEDWDEELSEPDELATRWLLFAKQLGAELPDRESEDNEDWVDSVVRMLAHKISARRDVIEQFALGGIK